MNKKQLSERDICTKFITPSLRQAGWDEIMQIREEVSFTKGRIIVRGKLVTRGKAKRADIGNPAAAVPGLRRYGTDHRVEAARHRSSGGGSTAPHKDGRASCRERV